MTSKSWPDYRAVWRWHFYAGLLCIPFVIILSISGLIYLFKPQIEAWSDAPYDQVTFSTAAKPVAEQVAAAIGAFPGSRFVSYEIPETQSHSARIVVRTTDGSMRVYVHPETLAVLHSVPEDGRLMRWIFRLHGELLMGDRGSNLVELAACWTIVLLLTGLFLWWPRNTKGLGGVLYPRLFGGSRMFWRDIHSVVGMWISFCAIFLLLTGLPWAKFWGDYFKQVRNLTGTAVAQQDWANSSRSKNAAEQGGEHSEHSSAHRTADGNGKKDSKAPKETLPIDLNIIEAMVSNVVPLNLDPPVIVSAPGGRSKTWNAKSNTPNRPRRVTVDLDPRTGAILGREDFGDKHWIDQAVGIGIAAHEGALFGWFNQLLGVLTTIGLVLLSVSGVILWWRRREQGVLGAPKPALKPAHSWGLLILIVGLGICLPLFAASLVVVLLCEWLVLSRIPAVSTWLGLVSAPQPAG